MKKLTRNWRKSRDEKLSLPTRDDLSQDDNRPMETQEQEELVRALEKEQAQQSRLWRRVFASILLCYGAFLVWSIFQQATFPWELRYHAYFMEDMDSWMVISADGLPLLCCLLDAIPLIERDWVAVLACTMATVALLRGSENRRRWIFYSCSTGGVLALFWLYFMLRLPRFRWDVIWLPFGPLSAAGLSLYIDHLLNESSEDVKKLRSYMYAFKAS